MQASIASMMFKVPKMALDLLLPLHCMGCGAQGETICDQCAVSLPRLHPPYCRICAVPGVAGVCGNCRDQTRFSSDHLSGIRAPFLMDGLTRDAILAFKYHNYRAAAPCLANLLAGYWREHPLPGNVLVPVPLHPRKRRERGYNQAELLATHLGKSVGLPVAKGLLSRLRNTPPQAAIEESTLRRENTAGAFACQGDATGLQCILIDDVCTTGSTLGACAEALMAGGAQSVWALTLARQEAGIKQ